LLIASLRDPNPVIYIDDRWLYTAEDDVPEEPFAEPIGKAAVRRSGRDITIVATSYMAAEAVQASDQLRTEGIGAEVIDLRTVRPIDEQTILDSIAKTHRLVVADAAWSMCGVSAEVAAIAAEKGFDWLRAPIERVTLPPCPAPMCAPHERAYYPRAPQVYEAVRRVLSWRPSRSASSTYSHFARQDV
jgi:pyruvate dehydrogenase E1 component beta subunit